MSEAVARKIAEVIESCDKKPKLRVPHKNATLDEIIEWNKELLEKLAEL